MKKTKTLSFLALLITIICAFAAFTFVGCKKPNNSGVTITLSQTEVNVNEGKKATITATVKGSDEEIVWAVEDEDIATVTAIKRVATVSAKKVGTTNLTASIGETKATCKITVKADNTEKVTITLDGTEVTETSVEAGSSKTLVATASLGSPITWETSNSKVVTVAGGVITGVNKGTATVTAKVTASIKAEVTVTVTGEGGEYKDLQNSGADGAVANKGTWTYWAAEWVIVDEAYSIGNDVTITFLNNDSDSPTFFYATQLFYKNASLVSGTRYKLTFDYDSPATGRITLNGNVINLEQGKHSCTTYYNEGDKSIDMQLGVNGVGMEIKEGTLSLSNLVWEEDTTTEQLAAPSFTYNSATGIITITDTENVKGSVGSYTLYFYDNDEVKGNTTVVNGAVVDLSTIPNGTWTAKLVAVAANVHYTNSDPSTDSVEITVANATTAITNGEEHDAYVNPGSWVEWHDQNWNGSNVTLGDAYIDGDGAIHYGFTISGSNQQNQAAHLYYHYSSCTPGTLYILTMKINATVACTVEICEVQTELAAGVNNISVPFVQPAENPAWNGLSKGATIRIYFNDDNTYVISGINVEEANQTQLDAPSFTVASNVITITDTNTEGVGKYELGFFQDEELKATADIVNGGTIDLSKVAAGTYTVKLRAVAESALYLTSDWSSTTASVTSSNTNVPIGYSEEGSLTSGWAYWDSKAAADWNQWTAATCSECYMDGDGTITMTYTCEGTGAAWAMQMFYKANDGATKWNSTLTIKADVACTITVCGQSITLEANTERQVPVTDYASANGSAIDIQFGCTGGTFTISSSTTPAA